MVLHKKVALFAMLLTVLLVAKFQSNKWQDWENEEKTFRPIVRSDGAGYYAYLPQVFIFKDNRFRFVQRVKDKYPDAKMHEFGNATPDNDGVYNKYFCGVALCQLPFFLVTHYTHSDKFASDGYSLPYQKALAIGAIFFLLIGLWLSYWVLLHFRIHPWVAAFSLTVFALGTTLLYYTVNEVLTSHVYSFALISLFFYSLIRWKESQSLGWLLLLVLAYAWVILLRPSNGIVFLLYFALFTNLKEAWRFLVNQLLSKVNRLIPALLLFSSLLFLQMTNVKYQTGHWGFNIYSNEGFTNWNQPPFLDVLFGFKKGLFIYAPLFFVSLFGFLYFRKKFAIANRYVLLFLIVFLYITASWWCWWYGGSLGMRPFVDVSLFFMLGLAFLLQYAKNWMRVVLVPILAFCVYYSFILTIQLDTAILHFADMDFARYKRIFLKTGDRFSWVFHLDEPKSLDHVDGLTQTPKMERPTQQGEPRPFKMHVEHMRLQEIATFPVDENIKRTVGLRLDLSYKISDNNNIPYIIYETKTAEGWKNTFTDFIGMRLPSLHTSYAIKSDLFITDEIRNADSLRIVFHNTHGRTTLSGFYNTRISFFAKK